MRVEIFLGVCCAGAGGAARGGLLPVRAILGGVVGEVSLTVVEALMVAVAVAVVVVVALARIHGGRNRLLECCRREEIVRATLAAAAAVM